MQVSSFLHVPLSRLDAAAHTWPSQQGWMGVAAALAFLILLALPLGLKTGFLVWEPLTNPAIVPPKLQTTTIAGLLATVCGATLVEEAIFRGMMLAHPAVDGARLGPAEFAAASALALAVYVGHHLLFAVAAPHESRDVFWDWRFLTLAGVLGAGCMSAYHASGGSLAATMVTHWLPVSAWMLLLGGYRKTLGGPLMGPVAGKPGPKTA